MKAEGSTQDPAAQHVLESCIKPQAIGLVELTTPKVCIVFVSLKIDSDATTVD